ncbi:MAG: signal recognition particle-docking protein FtsY [Aquificae bacterium]|nr:signal recognition particle-docking protein FtsY [Aquificota bacterium]
MVLFWRKSELEKRAEKGDKSALLELVKKGKKDKALSILKEKALESEELAELLFELLAQERRYQELYPYLKRFPSLGRALERARVYRSVGEYDEAIKEYLKVGSFEALKEAYETAYLKDDRKRAYELLKRALELAPPGEKERLEKERDRLERELGLKEEKKEGLLEKLRRGLAKTREAVELGLLFKARKIDEEFFEELEEQLVRADAGVKTALELVKELKREAARRGVKNAEALRGLFKKLLVKLLKPCEGKLKEPSGLTVYLLVGVNGSGKTTTAGKLAYRFTREGKKVLLVAADTFRAAAAEQLEVWARRSGAELVKGKEGADPASVVYEGMRKAKEELFDAVIVDTAGRLHTKEPLINELRKIVKVIKKFKEDEPSEVLLVIDATAGQNALVQAKVFKEAVKVTGIVVTKLDGSAKGGFILAVCRELKIPVKLVGVGEGPEDLQPFSAEAYAEALLG